jgi:hypothetical protein
MNDQSAPSPSRRRFGAADLLIVGLPGVAAAFLLLPLLGLFQESGPVQGPTPATVLLGNLLGIQAAIALMTLAIANAVRARSGLVLGVVAGLGSFGLAGLAVVSALDYGSRGGLGTVSAAFLALAAVGITAAGLALLAGLRMARPQFRSWGRPDAIVVAVLVALVATAIPLQSVLTAAVEGESVAADLSLEAAQAAVAGMLLQIAVVEAGVAPVAGSADPSVRAVQRLVIDVTFDGAQGLPLKDLPTLCLTHVSVTPFAGTADVCWGVPRTTAALPTAWAAFGRAIPTGRSTVRLTLLREDSLCVFPPGTWKAEFVLVPEGRYLGLFRVTTTFSIPDTGVGQTGEPSIVPGGDDCID